MGLLLSSVVFGDGIMGGHFEWECLGNDSFLVTLTLYEDCNASAGPYSALSVRSNCGSKTYSWTKGTAVDVTPVCNSSQSRCASSSSSIKYGINKTKLTAIIYVGDWTNKNCCYVVLSVKNSYRAPSLATSNVKDYFFLSAAFDKCTSTCPNSPKFNRDPDFIIPLGRNYSLDLAVTQEDGDSLVFSCFDPLAGLTRKTFWLPPPTGGPSYNGCSPVFKSSSFPSTINYNIDSNTGTISFRPMREEHTVLTLTVEQYRKGKLIARSNFESNAMVIKMPSNASPIISGINNSLPDAKNFNYAACAKTPFSFKIGVSDNDKSDTVKLSYLSHVPGAQFKTITTNPLRDTLEFSWTPDSNHIGKTYNFWVMATDSACPIMGTDHQRFTISVDDPSKALDFIYKKSYKACADYEFSVTEKNNTYYNPIVWKLNDSIALSRSYKFDHTFTQKGTYTMEANISNCSAPIFRDTLVVDHVYELKIEGIHDTTMCGHIDLHLDPVVTGANGPAQYIWTFDRQLLAWSKAKDSFAHVELPIRSGLKTYPLHLRITDSAGCRWSDTMYVDVKEPKKQRLMSDTLICAQSKLALPLKNFNNHLGWSGTNRLVNDTLFLDTAQFGNYQLEYLYEDDRYCAYDHATISYHRSAEINIQPSFTRCEYAPSLKLTATPTRGFWSGPGIVAHNFSPTSAGLGKHILVYSVEDTTGCADTDSIEATVIDDRPAINIPNIIKTCDNETPLTIVANPAGGRWEGAGKTVDDSILTLDPAKLGEGIYPLKYTLSDTITQCYNVDSGFVLIHKAPVAQFTLNDSLYFVGDKLDVTNTSITRGSTKFTWKMNTTPQTVFSGNEPGFTLDTNGVFSLTLMAHDPSSNCSDSFLAEDLIIVKLGTSNPSLNSEMERAYPNPTYGILNIPENVSLIKIYSMEGTLVWIDQPDEAAVTLPNLSEGTYLLVLTNQEGFITQKLQIKH